MATGPRLVIPDVDASALLRDRGCAGPYLTLDFAIIAQRTIRANPPERGSPSAWVVVRHDGKFYVVGYGPRGSEPTGQEW